MIRARFTGNDGRETLLFGLTSENIARLFANEPISLDTADAEPDGGLELVGGPRIVIVAGSNEAVIIESLREQGVPLPDEIPNVPT